MKGEKSRITFCLSQKSRMQGALGKEDTKKTLTANENEKARFCVYLQGCPPSGLRFPALVCELFACVQLHAIKAIIKNNATQSVCVHISNLQLNRILQRAHLYQKRPILYKTDLHYVEKTDTN